MNIDYTSAAGNDTQSDTEKVQATEKDGKSSETKAKPKKEVKGQEQLIVKHTVAEQSTSLNVLSLTWVGLEIS